MTWKTNMFQNLLTIIILLLLFLIIYLRVTNKTIPELMSEIKEGLSSPIEQ